MSIYRTDSELGSDIYARPVAQPRTIVKALTDVPPLRASLPPDPAVLALRKGKDAQAANVVLKHTSTWADTLPKSVHPRALIHQYPRVANMLALLWTELSRTLFDQYMESLLFDKRGGRQGFPPAV